MATPPWAILGRTLSVALGPDHPAAEPRPMRHSWAVGVDVEAQALADDVAFVETLSEHAAIDAAPDFTIPIVMPPRVAVVVAASRRVQPHPDNPDTYPYIIGARPHFILAHFSAWPMYGTTFADNPHRSNLVVVRNFETGDGCATATAEHVLDRPGHIPALRNVRGVVLATSGSDRYMIAELQVDKAGRDRATIIYLRSDGGDGWRVKSMRSPLAAVDRDREWRTHGAVFVGRTLWWFDLSWGLLGCDVSLGVSDLVFLPLPTARGGLIRERDPLEIHDMRCFTASGNKLRYVEILGLGDGARVCMWSLSLKPDGNGWQWDDMNYQMQFQEIWRDDSYRQTGLAWSVPKLAAVNPWDPNLVYFSLQRRLFGVDVPHHRVVHSADYELVNMPGTPPPGTSRYLVVWDMPEQGAQALHLSPTKDPGASYLLHVNLND